MVVLKIGLIIGGGVLFLVSAAGYLYVKLRLRPREQDMEEVYWEFEEQAEGMGRYERWSRRTFAGAAAGWRWSFSGRCCRQSKKQK